MTAIAATRPTKIAPVEHIALPGFSASDRNVIREIIHRDWRCHLRPAERDLIGYICAASIERGYEVLDCTWDQLTRGVRAIGKSMTKWLIPPIEISRATFYRMIDALKDRGILTIYSIHRTCTRIKINLNWTPESTVMAPKLAVSKRRKAEMEAEAEGGFGSQNEKPYTYTHHMSSSLSEKNLRAERVGPTLPQPSRKGTGEVISPVNRITPGRTARETLADVIGQSRARKAEKAKTLTSSEQIDALKATFDTAWVETNTKVQIPGWTEKEGYMLRASLRARFKDIPTRHAFLDFVVRNWTQIIVDKFGWMKRPAPPIFSLQFMLGTRTMPTFMDAFAERAKYQASKLVTGEEAQIARLIDQGMSRDEALIKMGERRALSKQGETRRQVSATHNIGARDRANLMEAQRQLLRDRAALAQEKAAPRPSVNEDLPAFDIEPIDPSMWGDKA